MYKPSCADIPPHKPSLQKPSEALLKGKKQSVVPRARPPAVGWPGKLSRDAELKQLEKFLHLHGLSLQETVRAETGMKYRYPACPTLGNLRLSVLQQMAMGPRERTRQLADIAVSLSTRPRTWSPQQAWGLRRH